MPRGGDELLAASLERLGFRSNGDALATVDALLREDPSRANRLGDDLLRVIASSDSDARIAPVYVAAGTVALVLGDPKRARDLLVEGLAHLPADAHAARARGALRLARAEAEAGSRQTARAGIARSVGGILSLGDDPVLGELATVLRAAGEPTSAEIVDHFRRERKTQPSDARGEARLEVVSRLTRALNSSLVGTAEPLNAILRAVLEETGAQRGFLMLYDEQALRFELGLARDGRVLGSADFRYSSTIVGAALEQARVILVPDVWQALPFAQATSANEMGLRSALCAPLHVARKRQGAVQDPVALNTVRGIAGVLYVDAQTAGSFTEKDAAFFEILADCAAVAVRASRTAQALRAAKAAESEQREATARSKRGPKKMLPPGGVPADEPSDEIKLDHPYREFVTRDPGMRSMLKLLDRVVASDANVVIRGESGTGKELVARAVHAYGKRRAGPFVAIDCGAVPDELVQSELFGNEANAYTGAGEARPGLIERADGGTLFLDEVGEMSPQMQAALLRVLQEGEVRRLGAEKARPFDIRVVVATHRDLRALVERGEFRHDLFFRLAVVEVKIPPLRERRGDVPVLVQHVLARLAERDGVKAPRIEAAALERLEEHGWPGNVRELENVIAALLLQGKDPIALPDVDHVLGRSPVRAAGPGSSESATGARASIDGTLEEIEQRIIADRLERFDWNQIQAAESLGIDRRTLYRKIRRYGLGRGRS